MSDSKAIVPVTSGTSVAAIIPQDFDSVLEYARLVQASGLAPKTIKTQEQVAVAIMHGYELGLTPLASLQSIAVINGRPSIWGDGALALAQASPVCEDITEEFKGEGESLTAICTVKRKGRSKPVVGEFSMADARQAKLLGKEGPWQEYPKRMLKMRARAFALRDAFADIFRGLSIAEEAQDMKDITPGDEAPAAPRETAPTAPSSTASSARVVEGEILPPKKAEGAKPTSTEKTESKADPKPKETPSTHTNEKKDDSAAAAPSSNGHGTRGSDEFEAYAKKLEAEMMAAVDDKGELQEIWKRRNKEWSEQELKWLVDIRDEMVVRHKDRKKAREEAAAARQAEAGQDESDDDMPGLGEEDFNEFDFRQAFTIRLGECKTAKEVLALKNEVDALKEKGLIVPSKYESIYEDALVTALERHERD